MKSIFLCCAVLSAVSGAATAQTSGGAPRAAGQTAQADGPRWGVGLGAAVSSGIYAGEGTRTRPIPLISYTGERFFWRGISGGAHLYQGDGFTLDATLSGRFDGIKRKDFGSAELAERGIRRDLLSDRDDGLDLGLSAQWRGDMGQLELGVKGDVTGASKGYEGTVKYGYRMQMGRTAVTPNVGVSFMSTKLANYYYGTLPEEVARGVVDYKPGSAVVPRIGVDVMHQFAGNWAVLGNVSYKKLPGKISDSPLVEKDKNGSASVFIGVSRGF